MQNERSSLFYAANFDPEVNRLFKSVQTGDVQRINMFKKVTLQTVENLLQDRNLSRGGWAEWVQVKDMVSNFENLDPGDQKFLCNYGAPFSYLFAKTSNL